MSKNNSLKDSFFETQKEKSRVKTLIVTDFFKAYFPIIHKGFQKTDVWYIDLFCGPGRYDDGTPSTPIKLLDVINEFKNGDVKKHLKIVFNDYDHGYIEKLKKYVSEHPVLPKLTFPPIITNCKASDVDLSEYTRDNKPIFSFVDPWGYKDVTVSQVWNLVKNPGSDCVLFFNADRILQDLNKPSSKQDFEQIFGQYFEKAKQIQIDRTLSQRKKTEDFLALFSRNLYETAKKESADRYLYILPFYVEADDKEKTSHYIVFISKAHKAIQEMRRVMINKGNSSSAQLGFDSKDELQISLFNRQDDSVRIIIDSIKTVFRKNPSYYTKKWKVTDVSRYLDQLSMSTQYRVFPYSHQDIKTAIQYLYEHDKDCIKILRPQGKSIRKAITDDREFYITDKIEGV